MEQTETPVEGQSQEEEVQKVSFMGTELDIKDPELAGQLNALEHKRMTESTERERSYARGIQEKSAELGRLQQQLLSSNAEAPVSNENLDDEFLASPTKFLDAREARLREEYQKSMQAMSEFVTNQQQRQAAETIMTKFYKTNPMLDNELGRAVVDGVCNEKDLAGYTDESSLMNEIARRSKKKITNYTSVQRRSGSFESASVNVAKEAGKEEERKDPFVKAHEVAQKRRGEL